MTNIDLGAWANDLFKIGTDYLSGVLIKPSTPPPVVYQPPTITTSSSDNILKIGLLAAAGVAIFMMVKK
jgi:hypothetical protein